MKYWKECGTTRTLCRLHSGKTTSDWSLCINIYTYTTDPEISILVLYSTDMIVYIHKRTCMTIFIAALFILAKIINNSNVYQHENMHIYLRFTYAVLKICNQRN